MTRFPELLLKKLDDKKIHQAYRSLGSNHKHVDFSSNDYLGFASEHNIYDRAKQLVSESFLKNGATGSRLISGNHELYAKTEDLLREFHQAEATLIFNSGYDANVGFFSTVPSRGDLVLYDELIHASIRDGIGLSHAKAIKFRHNDLEDLHAKIRRFQDPGIKNNIFIVTESVFSMDGDSPDLKLMAALAEDKDCYLIVDEAHALGVFGEKGEGLVQELGLQQQVFARVMTFGKALGAHGAAILGSQHLREYLINFSRSFIYTTALPPHAVACIYTAYEELTAEELQQPSETSVRGKLKGNIEFFRQEVQRLGLGSRFIESRSAIQSCIIPGNEKVKAVARELEKQGFEVKPILSPTVPEDRERLRFCQHAFNSMEEITGVLELLGKML